MEFLAYNLLKYNIDKAEIARFALSATNVADSLSLNPDNFKIASKENAMSYFHKIGLDALRTWHGSMPATIDKLTADGLLAQHKAKTNFNNTKYIKNKYIEFLMNCEKALCYEQVFAKRIEFIENYYKDLEIKYNFEKFTDQDKVSINNCAENYNFNAVIDSVINDARDETTEEFTKLQTLINGENNIELTGIYQ
jgi:hypothetical protein